MRRPFWPTTENGMFALRISGLAYLLFAGVGMFPSARTVFFNVLGYESTSEMIENPVWYTNWFAPVSSVGIIGLFFGSALLTLIASVRGHDRSWGLYLGLAPMLFIWFLQ